MAIYYISACHDCKEKVMWSKCSTETAEEWNGEFEEKLHKGHKVELGHDLDDDFYSNTFPYKDLGIWDEVN